MLESPRFHHVHLNSTDPAAAIDFYVRHFPCTERTTWGGQLALRSANDVLLLFEKVDAPPRLEPPSALWHFGWHVPDSRERMEALRRSGDIELLPLYTSDAGDAVYISSDTWPGEGGVLGLTRAQIEAARAKAVQPTRKAGFAYLRGPDGALVEYAGNYPSERFNHVHMWQDDPLCAQLWYRQHLNAAQVQDRAAPPSLTADNCKVPRGSERTWPCLEREGMFRTPRAAVTFGDVMLTWYARQDDAWYARQDDAPLASPRGYVFDHVGLGVIDLDAWIAKLEAEGIAPVERPYRLGDTRAAMIEGPSRELLELVELR